MSKLIFKGHATRGKELHKFLEYLGGVDAGYSTCSCVTFFYYINREGYIEGSNFIPDYMNHRMIMSLETFESKYPFKIGDFVMANDGTYGKIIKMGWDEYSNTVKYTFKDGGIDKVVRCGYTSEMLRSINKKETMEKEISGAIIYRFICLEGYDFYDDKGNIIETKEITMKKKQPQYPKTYKECCKIVGFNIEEEPTIFGYKDELLTSFQHLLICRDAYWKIAGDWNPDWLHDDTKYILHINSLDICKDMVKHSNYILAFPTEEMRDAFYENFKEVIESCKELL